MVDKFANNTLADVMRRLSSACDVMDRLKKSGYTNHFVLEGRSLVCLQNGHQYHQRKLEVEEIFWVDGGVTRDGVTIFALRDREEGLKGIFVAI